MNAKPPQSLFDKINALPAELQGEVETFVDALQDQTAERALVRATVRASRASLERVWANPEDDVYDRL